MKTTTSYDVIIIGGSYAGLSAAMALGRSLRKVLIIDSGQPCNRQTPHSHNFLTQDGETPAAIARKAKEQVLAYPTVTFLQDLVLEASSIDSGFEVLTQSDQSYRAQKLLLAFGIKDELPKTPGFAECWGISMIHCPYCHGYEFRGKKTGILATGDRAYHQAMLVSNLSDQVKIIVPEPSIFTPEQQEKLEKKGIRILDKEILEIRHEKGYLDSVQFTDGAEEIFDAIYADVPFSFPGTLVQNLGCKLADSGRIWVDQFQQTNIPGLYACGDCTTMMRSVASAVAAGNLTGAMINHALASERF
ncbi:NAD(P)/FAD-dependent oxidoreductase [Algoriphagus aestuariicola]|uniref:NAD(P)/FAD-dependent oxidoreductase n=1 Tax=Algoriphagus aestuariicola TaxID=1852016 RepID=A0ABS3BJQ0_9BACT|nr:NAD(P)/FAD-dependent oxidoreductase [Algoriphagus aestuariicola]MBN7799388.1 NAD(P)/FAD-dependent oxidoreductase [Algoriphagus aestuariicola]